MAHNGYKNSLNENNVWKLYKQNTSEIIVPKFEKYLPKYKLGEKVNIYFFKLYKKLVVIISQLNNLIYTYSFNNIYLSLFVLLYIHKTTNNVISHIGNLEYFNTEKTNYRIKNDIVVHQDWKDVPFLQKLHIQSATF